jgi:hypothetical protein
MSFVAPTWDSSSCHYVIELLSNFSEKTSLSIKKDTNASTVFTDVDLVENITSSVIHNLIDEGAAGNWFSKLPSHDQLMKRVRHTFKSLVKDDENAAALRTIILTPKQLTLVWEPFVRQRAILPISFEDSDESNSSADEEVELPESDLPPVQLTDDSQESQEEYLLTRLRAAKARVEAEQIRMQYFEATGRMPPDSESEDE